MHKPFASFGHLLFPTQNQIPGIPVCWKRNMLSPPSSNTILLMKDKVKQNLEPSTIFHQSGCHGAPQRGNALQRPTKQSDMSLRNWQPLDCTLLRKLPCLTSQEPLWQSHLHHPCWHWIPFTAGGSSGTPCSSHTHRQTRFPHQLDSQASHSRGSDDQILQIA